MAASALVAAAPAAAEVSAASGDGFVVRLTADVPASPDATWRALVKPAIWWDGEHSFSGDAANLSLDPRPGGCFCEVLPATAPMPKAVPRGGVEYMRVVYVERPRALRMVGALGPLQAEALIGTLTIQLKPLGTADGRVGAGAGQAGAGQAGEGQAGGAPSGTRILWEYVVGGFMRGQPAVVAAATDRLLAGQLARLAGKLGATHGMQPPAGSGFLEGVTPNADPAPAPAGPPDDSAGQPVVNGR